MKLKYYTELDGVRGIAALMVMFLHFFAQNTYKGHTAAILSKLSIVGQTGVDLFFVLSGFLITRILLKTKQHEGYFSSFYMRRALRIFPLYYLFLLLYYVVIPLLSDTIPTTISHQYYAWIYLQNFAMTFHWPYTGPPHFWSLAVEEHFYLFWPLLVFFLPNKKLIYAIIILVVISFFCRIALLNKGYEVYYFTFTRMDSLAIGAALALIEFKGLINSKASTKFLLMAAFVITPTLALWVNFGGDGNSYIQLFKPLLLALFFFALIGFIISSQEGNLKRWLRSPVMSYIGRISYGLYVYHPLCFTFFTKYYRTGNILVDLTGSFIVAFALATLSFYVFEKEILKLKKRYDYSNKLRQAMQAP